ncbi:energy transducer TonB [Microbulbifer epialgicus]|uniref:Protein TonB n=1 Tax=Microbulbifer epialgicus TaxID=393907 RepID=A0ABV4NUZ5_9GAMM
MDRVYPAISNPLFFQRHLFTAYAKGLAYAALITLGLIFLMSQLVASDIEEPKLNTLLPIKPVHMPKKVIVTQKFEQPEPPQVVIEQPKTRVLDPEITPVNTTLTIGAPTPTSTTPVLVSRDPVPVYKPSPRYPSAAMRRGIEGYVIVEFTVTKTGAVQDVRVVGAFDSVGNPTRIFDRSALAAAERFKYQPQVEDGKPIERYGVRNRITYKLAE